MNKFDLINMITNIDNIFKYSIKGGTSMFNKEYPNLLESINFETKEMQKYSNNKKLVAKLLYLKEYGGDINKIKNGGEVMIYDPQKKRFKVANLNAAQIQWDSYKHDLSNINDFYSKDETIQLLEHDYIKYFGKSGNRKLLKDDKKLYLSLYKHTSEMDGLNKNLNKFSMRLYILVKNVNIYCEKHKRLKFWKFSDNELIIICSKCEPKYPSKSWFQKKYGNEWESYFNARLDSVKTNKTNSLEWFIRKFGVDLGNVKYSNYVSDKMEKLSELKANKYSKISQELFWDIYEQLEDKEGVYFHDLNQEFVMQIPIIYNHENTVMMFDFKQKMKIIEYNGKYWHNNVKDNIRYSILKDIGYDILVIDSDEYNRNNKSDHIIEKCLNFLSCK